MAGPGADRASNRGYEGGFATAMMLKDLKLAQDAAARRARRRRWGRRPKGLYALSDRLGGGAKGLLGHPGDAAAAALSF
jgi:3-hydroxyisobutyrate dehydrogenase